MARRIRWSRRSQEDRKAIFSYWNERNLSKTYSKKLNKLFIKAVELLSIHPRLGRKTSEKEIRIKVVKDYLILYKYSDTELRVMSIFDSRQDPEKLKKRLKK